LFSIDFRVTCWSGIVNNLPVNVVQGRCDILIAVDWNAAHTRAELTDFVSITVS
jgi:hypothetical protein